MANTVTVEEMLAEVADWLELPKEPMAADGWFTIHDILALRPDQPEDTIYRHIMERYQRGELERVRYKNRHYYRKRKQEELRRGMDRTD